ncbi:radical SAM protein [Solemya pervernicosa gill symbiont]|uniref:Radical SAM protein n=2 Tax=Gammaproteobacteria incertae sedis TaxID=118884 RepID=A0A1T2L5E1_9GAMM|nr:TatD family nuclease-associated radical SAM protein [Candidatus Reidiella endopervernicosa]OOZ40327.1 radical SAM protein [Solemya pervernicosa gill symbiont]QKQ24851.1 radical SAM protein [Candidatus Reidiella endopervernicosa]
MSAEQTEHDPAVNPTISYELHGNCYLNITYHCTLRCAFCPKFNGSWEVQGFDLRLFEEPSAEKVVEEVGDPDRYKQIVFCGLGEPTTRLDVLLEVAEQLKAQGATIRVNTDGLASLIHGRDVAPELAGKVDALSISMNAHNSELYDRHCRPKCEGGFEAMLDFARKAKAYVPSVTLTAIDGLEGVDIDACEKIAAEIGVAFRRRVLDEVG